MVVLAWREAYPMSSLPLKNRPYNFGKKCSLMSHYENGYEITNDYIPQTSNHIRMCGVHQNIYAYLKLAHTKTVLCIWRYFL